MSNNGYPKEAENFISLAIIFFVILIVAAVTFSAYLFIDISRVSNIANVHVTKNLKMAANEAKGNLYTNTEKGIENWIVYADRQNGFEIKYPNEYKFAKNENDNLLSLKKSNITPQGSNSLSSAIYVKVKDATDGTSIREEIEKMGITWDEKWTQKEIGGRPGISTGEVIDKDGMERELIIWQFGGKIFSLEEYHFNEDSRKDSELFNKIVSEFRFL